MPIGPVRAQLAPPVANIVHARAPPGRIPVPVYNKQPPRVVVEVPIPAITITETKEQANGLLHEDGEDDMDIEEDHPIVGRELDTNDVAGELEVEEMVVVDDEQEEDAEEEETTKVSEPLHARVWPDVSPERAERYRREVQRIRDTFEEELDMEDTTMVSEYAEEIYEYMCELEVGLTLHSPLRV